MVSSSLQRMRERVLLVFLIPTLIILGVFIAYPAVFAFRQSLFSWNIGMPQRGCPFIGLGNYQNILSDPQALNSFRVTFYFIVLAVPFEFLIGFGIALLLNKELKGVKIFRSILVIPLMITPVVAGFAWLSLYNKDFGLINYLLESIGIRGPVWLANSKLVMPALALVDVWQWTPFVILVVLAGLHGIPSELLEAAQIDGASFRHSLRYIIVPLLKPTLLIIILFRVTDCLKLFDIVYVLTQGGPSNNTDVISFYTYRQAFRSLEMGYASAVSILVLFLSIGISIFALLQIRRTSQV